MGNFNKEYLIMLNQEIKSINMTSKSSDVMKKEFYLLIDSCFVCCYAATMWLEEFQNKEEFKGILVREDKPSESVMKRRIDFHANHADQRELSEEMCCDLAQLYGSFDETDRAMAEMFGIPKYSVTHDSKTVFMGDDINGESAKAWLMKNCSNSQPFIFTHLGQILKSFWLEFTDNNLFNVHSAVLPYARGIYSIENVAALNDIDLFKRAAGVTIHLIDQGVDTGPIIRAERILNPFSFDSIWELKAYTFMIGYRLYAETAKRIIFDSSTVPVAIVADPNLRGPSFRAKDFTMEQKQLSEKNYLSMKKENLRKKNRFY
jgi:phosphoribosylglycinamide formyltransferase-1